MKRTITMPDDLENRAAVQARREGISLDEFVVRAVQERVDHNGESSPANSEDPTKVDATDPLFQLEIYEGPAPSDGSINLDHYLYGKKKRSR